MSRAAVYVLIALFAIQAVTVSGWEVHLVADTPAEPYAGTTELLGVFGIIGGLLVAVILSWLVRKSR